MMLFLSYREFAKLILNEEFSCHLLRHRSHKTFSFPICKLSPWFFLTISYDWLDRDVQYLYLERTVSKQNENMAYCKICYSNFYLRNKYFNIFSIYSRYAIPRNLYINRIVLSIYLPRVFNIFPIYCRKVTINDLPEYRIFGQILGRMVTFIKICISIIYIYTLSDLHRRGIITLNILLGKVLN